MDINTIKNRLINYKNYGKLRHELVNEIQTTLLSKNKESEFHSLLQKVENELGIPQSFSKLK
ncbi:MAG: hypothetical protein MJB14_15780 [Spirochaetes bacterium]|nr:hypothetical protein [Spirochaetota bacterium]